MSKLWPLSKEILSHFYFSFQQGFDKVLTDLTSLVEHYSQYADGLPCKLLLGGSNVLCEDENYISMIPNDPDYQNLSDFTAMMAELN